MNNYENGNIKKISEYLEKVRFRKKYFGGVKEQDVWIKISYLNTMYEEALKAERARYDAMIEHYKKTGKEKLGRELVYDE